MLYPAELRAPEVDDAAHNNGFGAKVTTVKNHDGCVPGARF